MPRKCATLLASLLIVASRALFAESEDPGKIVTDLPPPGRAYVGSPSIVVSHDGGIVVAHDYFGSGTLNNSSAVYRSDDHGESWERTAVLTGQYWSGLFANGDDIYYMGPNRLIGNLVIRKSTDGGRNWGTPSLLGNLALYHTSSVPVVVQGGRIWRGVERMMPPQKWPQSFEAMVMSAPIDADLTDPTSWKLSSQTPFQGTGLPGNGFLEGNVVPTPEGGVALMMRLDTNDGQKGARFDVTGDGSALVSPRTFDFSGGAVKFQIRVDPATGEYWALGNPVDPRSIGPGTVAQSYRNRLGIYHSLDLEKWDLVKVIRQCTNFRQRGWQYPDFTFDGDDIVYVARTAWDDQWGGAPTAHDANLLTFGRIENYKALAITAADQSWADYQ